MPEVLSPSTCKPWLNYCTAPTTYLNNYVESIYFRDLLRTLLVSCSGKQAGDDTRFHTFSSLSGPFHPARGRIQFFKLPSLSIFSFSPRKCLNSGMMGSWPHTLVYLCFFSHRWLAMLLSSRGIEKPMQIKVSGTALGNPWFSRE